MMSMILTADIKNEAGLYEIYNRINGKRYIGQSVRVRTRLLRHINLLNKNEHPNKHLQSSWNYYGTDYFNFRVLEYCDLEILDQKEDYYIAKYKSNDSQFGFNYRIDNKTNRGLKWSSAQREKMVKAIENNLWYHNHSIPQATMEKAWEATRNRAWTVEQRAKHSRILKGLKVSDTSRMKLAQQGEGNPSCKISEESVKEIIMLLKNNYCSAAVLANVYQITLSNIYAIKQSRSWKHLNRAAIEEHYFLSGVDKVNEYYRNYKENSTDASV